MGIFDSLFREHNEKMSDISFRCMTFFFKIADFFNPYIEKRIPKFNIQEGMTVVDYGCGPGRYTMPIARLIGEKGKVYAIDIHKLAITEVMRKVEKNGLTNVETVLAHGYSNAVPDDIADIVCALDMFFGVKSPRDFLAEVKRIIKKDGILIIDDGHQSRTETKNKIAASGMWVIVEETADHLKCKVKP